MILLRKSCLLAVPILISGCVLPPAISVISTALDGVSFLATKKSVSSHAVSVIAQKDCALWRIIKLEDICSDEPIPDYGETLAVAYSYPGSGRSTGIDVLREGRTSLVAPAVADGPDVDAASLAKLEPELSSEPVLRAEDAMAVVLAAYAPAAGPDAVRTVRPQAKPIVPIRPLPIATKRSFTAKQMKRSHTVKQMKLFLTVKQSTSTTKKGRYLILGSFHDREMAARHIRKLGNFGLSIVAAEVEGKTAYRVAAGPYVDSDSLSLARRHFASSGVPDAWPLRL